MVIHSAISKEEINELPKVIFEGQIHVIDSTADTEKAVYYLSRQSVVGIDSETRPSFKKGKTNKVSLFQISTSEHCFLFRLNKIENPAPLIRFLENPQIVKIGISLKDDESSLRRRYKFTPGGWVDLQTFVIPFGITDKSLQKIYAILFGEKISKSQRLTNWEADELTQAQKIYAATDAWTCLKIYNLLNELKRSGNYETIIHSFNKELKNDNLSE